MSRSTAGRHRSGCGAVASALLARCSVSPARRSSFAAPRRSKRMTTRWPATRVHMRIVINFDGEPDPRWFLLRWPAPAGDRPAEDQFRDRPQGAEGEGADQERPLRTASTTRRSAPDPRGQGPFVVDKLDMLPNEARRRATGWSRTSRRAPQSAFDAALALQAQTTGSTEATPKSERLGLRTGRARPALHHRHRPRPWRHRRRRGRPERHGRRRTSR